jgi:hypothetical protein
MEGTKLFTLGQATKTLPLVQSIVSDILKTGQAIRKLSVEMEKPEEDPEINKLMDLLDELFEEIERLGCYYKDWNFTVGLVDFPAKLHGRDVMFCWRSDEAAIRYYHDAEAGYAGRRLIPKEILEDRS